MTQADLPLAGVVVVELSDNASLPFCGQVLAGLGAEVWKVERPQGDCSRGWGPGVWQGTGVAFHAVNRGKKSVRLDIKDPRQLAILKKLVIGHADVFMHNLRPGSVEQYGLDPESLRSHKPDLICCELGAFGHVGPMSKRPGYDPLVQAFSGMMSVTGEDGRPPVRAGVPIVDFGSALWTVIGAIAALYRRKETKVGATVNSSLLETAMAWMAFSVANHATTAQPDTRHGSGIALVVPHRVYAVADGYLGVASANERLFGRLCDALGKTEWLDNPKFATNAARLQNRLEIDGLIEAELMKHTRAYWGERLDACGVPNAPLQTTAEICAHEQIMALGILAKPDEEEVPLVGLPISFDRQRPPPLSSAPTLGQDNEKLQALLASES
ncbi:crotonobetainyl-CoA:carnitine CoA-transferase CaiB-like acyl-CoA transferase [Paraburkholderia sp. HC6.4b]|uniref:CaiB/BaiF CoA transferase family protein n=1 Tax=unclassified Paraburkholderia TaxID=2615204 RepID=UPI001609730D|nr:MULTISPECIES: CoA transferase [unclassified Paraburkholderia]MBB5406319.1 crotonobetainyl-CoA:carnitine CoA-transferase CaiB-like acyl-CoA transferase [Paraburkholderia sp. HC6.4b]MBB5448717.1 crotonobetainyl-CoA:carnitine CoA-transferase CaiB-like acyl-CoA transferase [Paraburkholderia sp. Kb1A]